MNADAFPFDSEDIGSAYSVFNSVRLSTRVTPADRAAGGGDWCETFAISQDVVGLSIGDVCGHGAAAFPAMVMVRQAVRDAALRGCDPAQTLDAANRAVCKLEPGFLATAIFALLNTRTKTLTFSNAGHPPPLLVGRGDSRFLSYARADLPIGIRVGPLPALRVVSLTTKTMLVLYTDGVTEHERLPLLGETQLLDAATLAYARSAHPTALAIEELMFEPGASNEDDVSILVAWSPRASAGAHHPRLHPPHCRRRYPETFAKAPLYLVPSVARFRRAG